MQRHETNSKYLSFKLVKTICLATITAVISIRVLSKLYDFIMKLMPTEMNANSPAAKINYYDEYEQDTLPKKNLLTGEDVNSYSDKTELESF